MKKVEYNFELTYVKSGPGGMSRKKNINQNQDQFPTKESRF
jgi:hypothetical protein